MQVRATPTAGILVRALALGACHLGVGGCAVAAPASASAPQEAAPAPTAERFYPIDATPVRAARLAQRAQAELEALAAVDFAALDLDDRVDHVLLRHELAYELALYAEEQARLARLAPLLPFAERIERLDDARRSSPRTPRRR